MAFQIIQISKFSWGGMPPDPPRMSCYAAELPSAIMVFTSLVLSYRSCPPLSSSFLRPWIFHDLLLERALFACIIMQLQSNKLKKHCSRPDDKQYQLLPYLAQFIIRLVPSLQGNVI